MEHPREDLDDLNTEFCAFCDQNEETDRDMVIDLLAQLCRLVVDMCSVPLVQPSPNSTTKEEFDFNQLFDSGHHGNDTTCKFLYSSTYVISSVNHLDSAPIFFKGIPMWLACLVAGGALSVDFDIKTICLHTVLDLIEASTSIYGWAVSTTNNERHEKQPWSRSGFLLPVLAPDVLSCLAKFLDFFLVREI